MSSKPLAALVGVALALGGAGASMAACVGDDPAPLVGPQQDAAVTPTPAPTTTTPAPGLAANGTACTAASACTSGHCVDGVCCESACAGICERCDSSGRCEAVPEGEDPANDCPTTPISEPDAGGPSELDAGSDPDAASSDPDAGDAAADVPFVNPDGGTPPTKGDQCAGKCNGKRACAYPGTERTCGDAFCGNSTTQGRASCDGAGHCFYGREECSAFLCPDGHAGCKAMCLTNGDCQPTHYCDGPNGCKPKLGLGTKCSAAPECGSGFCRNAVCCDSPCDIDASFRCDSSTGSAKPGQCSCAACATGPCALFYEDKDLDGYGSKTASLAMNTAKYDCADKVMAGWSKTNTDCFDGPGPNAASVHPGAGFQTFQYTNPAIGVPSWDWDCSGTVTEEWPETTATSCRLCGTIGKVCSTSLSKCGAFGTPSGHSCGFDRTKQCAPDDVSAFREPMGCGQPGTLYTCGKCAGGVGPGVSSKSAVQRCR